MAGQSDTPYLDALRAYAERRPGRFHVPGHKGGIGADPGLVEAIGERVLALDIPALTYGIDVGEEPTPFGAAQALAAEAWGASRTWWLVNGASQGNHVALLALGHSGHSVVTQRNAHSSTIDALVMSGLRPTFVAPELDPELHIAHCMSPEALDARSTKRRRPWARRSCRPPTSARWRTWRGWSRWPTGTACRWWWTRRGARTSRSTTGCPPTH